MVGITLCTFGIGFFYLFSLPTAKKKMTMKFDVLTLSSTHDVQKMSLDRRLIVCVCVLRNKIPIFRANELKKFTNVSGMTRSHETNVVFLDSAQSMLKEVLNF